MDIQYFDTLESTNQYCKLLDPERVGEFTVICARRQTAGVGQQGNVWVSEAGKNLTFSAVLKPTFMPAADQYRLTMMLALAVAETAAALLPGERVRIKWPNDIYVGDHKLCGILTTNLLQRGHIGQSICGVGLNVNQTDFPAWVPNPVSLKQLTGREHALEPLLLRLLEAIEKGYRTLQKSPQTIAEQYLGLLYRRGEEAEYEQGGRRLRAVLEGVDRFGHLLLRTANGEELVCDMKEVRFVI